MAAAKSGQIQYASIGNVGQRLCHQSRPCRVGRGLISRLNSHWSAGWPIAYPNPKCESVSEETAISLHTLSVGKATPSHSDESGVSTSNVGSPESACPGSLHTVKCVDDNRTARSIHSLATVSVAQSRFQSIGIPETRAVSPSEVVGV